MRLQSITADPHVLKKKLENKPFFIALVISLLFLKQPYPCLSIFRSDQKARKYLAAGSLNTQRSATRITPLLITASRSHLGPEALLPFSVISVDPSAWKFSHFYPFVPNPLSKLPQKAAKHNYNNPLRKVDKKSLSLTCSLLLLLSFKWQKKKKKIKLHSSWVTLRKKSQVKSQL